MLLIVAHYKSSLKRPFHEKKTILKEKVAEKTKSITESITKSILRAVASRVFAEGEMKDHVSGKSPEPLFREFDSSAGLASMVTIRDVTKNPFISLDACMFLSTTCPVASTRPS
jgi:outer membrane lipoprotein-sorting protein